MRVRLDQVREQPLAWQETLAVPPAALNRQEVIGLGTLSCRGQIMYAPPGFVVQARLSYEQTLACTRCLSPVTEPILSELEVVVIARPERTVGQPSGEAEGQLGDDDLSVVVLEGEELDTEPLVVEQLQLNLPMKPLCQPGCRGLCPQCGTNLNEGSCRCAHQASDPRWTGLQALRKDLASREARDHSQGREKGNG